MKGFIMPELVKYLQVDLTEAQAKHIHALLLPGLFSSLPEEQSVFVAMRDGQTIWK